MSLSEESFSPLSLPRWRLDDGKHLAPEVGEGPSLRATLEQSGHEVSTFQHSTQTPSPLPNHQASPPAAAQPVFQFRDFSGFIPVFKPKGMVSKDVSRQLGRRLRRIKMGHVGTLDPSAEGILGIVFGAATKLQDRLIELPKTYEFTMRLGEETDTLDAEGQSVGTAPWAQVTSASMITDALTGLVGVVEQVPPLFSAIKLKGRPLYDYARAGLGDSIDLSALSRKVCIYGAELLDFAPGKPELRLRLRCGRGTYVRAFARDLARALGTVATVVELARSECAGTKSGESINLATLLAQLDQGIHPTNLPEFVTMQELLQRVAQNVGAAKQEVGV